MKRDVFFISDSTGMTAQRLGESLLAQFDHINFECHKIPFINDTERARDAAAKIQQACLSSKQSAIVIESIVDPELQAIIATTEAYRIDLLRTFLQPLEQVLGQESNHRVGRRPKQDVHQLDASSAVHFAMSNDDGAKTKHYDDADLIILGVSRTGKTPTSMYMALQFGLKTANYPITDEDLEEDRLPKALVPFQGKLFGLTMSPLKLSTIRNQRMPNSRYATVRQCEYELNAAESMYRRYKIPYIDTSDLSIEEIASKLRHDAAL